ncbi:PREDICTED: putative pectinesterase 11 [Tarenaya hassleriana]|uniref:putative pectinesterase 11 n=1 Tax=Tarenaya hassleriana TaxID=28532 RepID=UPI00053C2454|nr:PREDICTED: putative pectinesterase 11 [Tarenaya hassleriana]
MHDRQDVKMHMGLAKAGLYHRDHLAIFNVFRLISAFISFVLYSNMVSSSSIDLSTAVLIRVDQSGKGDFTKIQEAIDAVPPNLNDTHLYFIWVKPGIYREKVVVAEDKPYITLSGTQASNTILTWNDGQDILASPTLTVFASDFVCRFLTIQNTFGTAGQAVALRVAAERAAFYGCAIKSYQDTLLDDNGNHYFKNCYIEGATDFICGSASSLFERCHLHSLSSNNGSITAQMRSSATEKSGFTFLGCKVTGLGSTFLGRPWGAYSRVVFAYSFLSNVVSPDGWNEWGDPSKESTVYYGEYRCYGDGADRSKRVKWSKQLSDEEAAAFLSKDMIGGKDWLRPAPSHFRTSSHIKT